VDGVSPVRRNSTLAAIKCDAQIKDANLIAGLDRIIRRLNDATVDLAVIEKNTNFAGSVDSLKSSVFSIAFRSMKSTTIRSRGDEGECAASDAAPWLFQGPRFKHWR
jgi:hypothetical protein